jgi:hypothetical protein
MRMNECFKLPMNVCEFRFSQFLNPKPSLSSSSSFPLDVWYPLPLFCLGYSLVDCDEKRTTIRQGSIMMDCERRNEVLNSIDALQKRLFSPQEDTSLVPTLSTFFRLLLSYEHYLFYNHTEKLTLSERNAHEGHLKEIRTCFLPHLRSGLHTCFLSLSYCSSLEDVSRLTSVCVHDSPCKIHWLEGERLGS